MCSKDDEDRYLSTKEEAALLGMSLRNYQRARAAKIDLPGGTKIAGKVRRTLKDINDWKKRHRVGDEGGQSNSSQGD